MADTKRVLTTIASSTVLAKLKALQSPAEVDYERATNAHALQALAWRRAFDLIFVELPFPGLELSGCLKTLRSSECASAKSPVVLFGRQGYETDLAKLNPRLMELVTACTTLPQTLKAFADTLNLSDRRSVRLFAETERVVDSVRLRRVCQTENISASGMLLRTEQYLPLTSVLPFSLQLPDDVTPIHGRGEVVRHTDDSTEDISGMGVRFFGLDGNGSSRLRAFLGRKLD